MKLTQIFRSHRGKTTILALLAIVISVSVPTVLRQHHHSGLETTESCSVCVLASARAIPATTTTTLPPTPSVILESAEPENTIVPLDVPSTRSERAPPAV